MTAELSQIPLAAFAIPALAESIHFGHDGIQVLQVQFTSFHWGVLLSCGIRHQPQRSQRIQGWGGKTVFRSKI